MFEFNNHMLESLFNIFGGIATLYASIGYIVSVIFSKIMFDILGVKPILSLIPFYNTYRIYKEYKGRVWKRNWGVIYLLIFDVYPKFWTHIFSLDKWMLSCIVQVTSILFLIEFSCYCNNLYTHLQLY